MEMHSICKSWLSKKQNRKIYNSLLTWRNHRLSCKNHWFSFFFFSCCQAVDNDGKKLFFLVSKLLVVCYQCSFVCVWVCVWVVCIDWVFNGRLNATEISIAKRVESALCGDEKCATWDKKLLNHVFLFYVWLRPFCASFPPSIFIARHTHTENVSRSLLPLNC